MWWRPLETKSLEYIQWKKSSFQLTFLNCMLHNVWSTMSVMLKWLWWLFHSGIIHWFKQKKGNYGIKQILLQYSIFLTEVYSQSGFLWYNHYWCCRKMFSHDCKIVSLSNCHQVKTSLMIGQHCFRVLSDDTETPHVNTLRPRQNWRHFAYSIFKYIFLNENI